MKNANGEPVSDATPGDSGARRAWSSWAIDWLGVSAFLALFTACSVVLAQNVRTVEPAVAVVTVGFGVLLSWFLADALSGLVHYLADNYGSPDWPIVGDAFIRPFREHHDHPERMLEHGILERSGGPALLASLALGASLAIQGPALVELGVLGFSLGLGGFTALTNEVHALAHRSQVPRWARILQRSGIFLSPEAHSKHHQGNHDSHYCITSGVVDRLLGG